MAQTPQHSHNPCSLNYNEQKPAKTWELLRRNEKVGRALQKLQKLDADEKANHIYGLARTSYRIIQALKRRHEFAAYALQWLVPEPEFLISHVALSQTLDSAGRVELEIIAEDRGTTSDPNDRAHWSREDFVKGRPRGAVGEVLLRGPIVSRQVSDDPRFCSKVNPLQEWQDYFEVKKLKFTLETPWHEAPPGFRRGFCWLWRLRDSRAVSPDTGLRHDAPEPLETDLFRDWHLGKAFLRCCKTGQMNSEDLATFFQFQELADDYNIFAIPKYIPSRMAAREMADWLLERLAVKLPARESETLGSPLQWDILLTVEDLMRKGAPLDEALQVSFENLELHADSWHEGQPMPNQKKGWAQRGTDWQNTYRIMNSPGLGTGLIQKIFPIKPVVVASSSPSAT